LLGDLIERCLAEGRRAYRRNAGDCPEVRKLDRHEPVSIGGETFTCWRELMVYRMAEQITAWCPSAEVEVTLDGNGSSIEVAVSPDEEKTLASRLEGLFMTADAIRRKRFQ